MYEKQRIDRIYMIFHIYSIENQQTEQIVYDFSYISADLCKRSKVKKKNPKPFKKGDFGTLPRRIGS